MFGESIILEIKLYSLVLSSPFSNGLVLGSIPKKVKEVLPPLMLESRNSWFLLCVRKADSHSGAVQRLTNSAENRI